MMNTLKENSRLWLGAFALLAFGSLAGCISDDSDPAEDDENGGAGGSVGGTGGSTSGTGGSTSGTGGTTSGPPGTACASVVTIPADKPLIADFETDTPPAADMLGKWSFALGNDTALGVFTGPFGYGDHAEDMTGQPIPETFALVTGHDSTYALGIADSEADEYGGGMGMWLSVCLDATAFTGISFWVRGTAPTGTAKLTILMNETTSSTAPGAKKGTCSGVETADAATTTCVHPNAMFPVTDAWSEVRVPWSAITAGKDVNTPVVPDGHNIWQVQFDVGLNWVDGGGGVYVPTPAEYSFEVDDLAFY